MNVEAEAGLPWLHVQHGLFLTCNEHDKHVFDFQMQKHHLLVFHTH